MLRLTLLAVLSALLSSAQIGSSTITGRVTDSTGAAVPSVKVTLVATEQNFTFSSTTNDEGLYRVVSLGPGLYRITFEAQGFKRLIRENVDLRIGDTLAVDGVLQVGNTSEQIEVTSQVALLETETSATGAIMEGSTLYRMPLYQRYINSTLNLVPGLSAGGYVYGGGLGGFHLAGQRDTAIGIFEDGVNGNDQLGGTGTIKPVQNAVAEVKVLTTTLPAEYGHSAGGVISTVKKSGTNEFHGMGSAFGRTRRMQHRLYFDKFRTSDPQPGAPNGVPSFFLQPDFNIGGPISIPKIYNGKNKTFFFYAFQKLVEKKIAQVVAATPTDAMKGGDFSFAGRGNQIFDPLTTRLVNGAWTRDPVPGNLIPASRFDPVARRVLNLNPWVSPNLPGTLNADGPVGNLLANELARTFFDDHSLRLDHQFHPNFKIYGSWTHNYQSGFGRPINIQNADFDAQQGNISPFWQHNYSLGKTWIINPSMVNDARVGYYRRRNETLVPSFGKNYSQLLGIPNNNADLLPQFGSGGRDSADSLYGLTGAGPSRLVNETISFRDDLTKTAGAHAFKMGYELLRFRLNSTVTNRPSGNFAFDGMTAGLQASGLSVPATGNTFAGFLFGSVRQATFDAELTSWLPRSSIHSFYFQDDWKFSRTLTLNLGVRYSNESPFTTKYGLMTNFDPTGRDDVRAGAIGSFIHPKTALNRRDNNNFQPRIGAAWHPKEKWVFRGGFGLNTVDVKFPALRAQFDEYVAVVNQQAAPGDPRPIYQISRGPDPVRFNIRPDGTAPYSGSNLGARSAEYWDPNLRNPYVLNWNSSVQYQLSTNYVLEFSYQGSSGVGLIERWQYNAFPLSLAQGNLAEQNRINAQAQNFRTFPQFGDVRLRSNFGHSTFHGGTIKLEKRMSNGLFFNTFYTYSKAINSQDNDNDGNGVAPLENRRLEKARAGYDRNHRYIGVVNYELPFGQGKKFMNRGGFWNYLFGGYDVAWIQTYESGNPLTFGFANSPNNYYPTFAGNRRPDLVSQPAIRDGWRDLGGDRFNIQNINGIIDMSAFAYPNAYTTGNSGRNILTGTPLIWSQISASKRFTVKERWAFLVRWDFQNALKTYNFNPPTTTVDTRNPRTFGKLSSDPRTASVGGQPLMNLTLQMVF